MTISLTPELERFVREQVESGRFASASEVLRAGLRLLSDQEHDRDSKRAALRAWIKDAVDDGRPTLSEESVLARVEARLATLAAKAQ